MENGFAVHFAKQRAPYSFYETTSITRGSAISVAIPMSNPLIKPNDPRFQNRDPRDALGKNLFAEPAEVLEQSSAGSSEGPPNLYATQAAASTEKPYQPEYLTTQPHRGMLLLVLAIVGLSGNAGATLALSGIWLAVVLPVLAIFPAAAALLLGQQDLRAMGVGAMDRTGIALTRIAFWMGVAGVVCSLLSCFGLLFLALGWAAQAQG